MKPHLTARETRKGWETMVGSGLAVVRTLLCYATILWIAASIGGCGGPRQPTEEYEPFQVAYWQDQDDALEWPKSERLDALILIRAEDDDIVGLCASGVRSIAYLCIRSTWIGSSTNVPSITDRGIEALAAGPSLLILELEEQEKVTAASLRTLVESQPTLIKLIVKYCSSVDAAELNHIQNDFPRIIMEAQFRPQPPDPEGDPSPQPPVPERDH